MSNYRTLDSLPERSMGPNPKRQKLSVDSDKPATTTVTVKEEPGLEAPIKKEPGLEAVSDERNEDDMLRTFLVQLDNRLRLEKAQHLQKSIDEVYKELQESLKVDVLEDGTRIFTTGDGAEIIIIINTAKKSGVPGDT